MVRAADRAKNPARSSVWLEDRTARPGSARKAARPADAAAEAAAGLDRDRIVDAAVRLLDGEGLAKFSMRRLATELNVTAMSLYWYVDTKDDILELAVDAVFAEVDPDTLQAAPDGEPADWRDRLRRLAAFYRKILVDHPWVSPIMHTYLNIGPSSLAFSRAVQDIVRATGLPTRDHSGAIAAVFQFAYGFGTIQGHFIRRCAESGMSVDEFHSEAVAVFREEPRFEDDLETIDAVLDARAGETVTDMWQYDFEFALEMMIAGIEAMVARREKRA